MVSFHSTHFHQALAEHPLHNMRIQAGHVLTPLQELRQALDDERKANDQLMEQTDRDRAKIDDLEGRSALLLLGMLANTSR